MAEKLGKLKGIKKDLMISKTRIMLLSALLLMLFYGGSILTTDFLVQPGSCKEKQEEYRDEQSLYKYIHSCIYEQVKRMLASFNATRIIEKLTPGPGIYKTLVDEIE